MNYEARCGRMTARDHRQLGEAYEDMAGKSRYWKYIQLLLAIGRLDLMNLSYDERHNICKQVIAPVEKLTPCWAGNMIDQNFKTRNGVYWNLLNSMSTLGFIDNQELVAWEYGVWQTLHEIAR